MHNHIIAMATTSKQAEEEINSIWSFRIESNRNFFFPSTSMQNSKIFDDNLAMIGPAKMVMLKDDGGGEEEKSTNLLIGAQGAESFFFFFFHPPKIQRLLIVEDRLKSSKSKGL